jgi:hypothetical protein
VDPNLDLDWYRTYSAEMLYPDPDSINPDPKHCLGLRQTTEEKGIEGNRQMGGKGDSGAMTDW